MAQYNKNLFLAQSYMDSYDEYEKSLTKKSYPLWDYIVLTASNEAQAESYRAQIQYRLDNGFLPSKTVYEVIPDPDGKRVGSGGATLNVMKYIRSRESSFTGKKILVIHSGGDSKRVPQYSVCGKLFSPVPRTIGQNRRSTLFDEFVIAMTGVPARMKDGMLVCSGDVLLLFNPLQMDFYGKGAACLSIKENVQTGKNHGVFVADENKNVGYFLHKQTVETLTEKGAVDSKNNVNIDTGAVIFDSFMLNDLYTLVDTDEKFNEFVNDKVRISFYADFLYPLASHSTLEQYYLEQPEGDFSDELKACRTKIWDVLRPYSMRLLVFAPASFIHFGTTKELLALMTSEIKEFSFLKWDNHINTNTKDKHYAASNAYISTKAKIGEGSYIEDSLIHKDTVVGKNCIVSNVILTGQTIPDGTVLHGVCLEDGSYVVRMYGVCDNPKEKKWFGDEIDEPLWTKKLFVPCKGDWKDAVDATLSHKTSESALSLCESFNLASTKGLLSWQENLLDRVHAEMILDAVENATPSKEVAKTLKDCFTPGVEKRLLTVCERLNPYDENETKTLTGIYYYLSKLKPHSEYLTKAFENVCVSVLGTQNQDALYNETAKIVRDRVKVSLPVRVNFGGGWSDTPPYCNDNGGKVLNGAIKINGIYPIEAEAKKIDRKKIILASLDNDSYQEFDSVEELQNCSDVGDPFALHKAALLVSGIVPAHKKISMAELTDKLGSGFCFTTKVINIPRGSGLGTSSILAGACMKALLEFIGVELSENALYNKVMFMEQLMSTGGGWQDQVGGLCKGIKMVSAKKGLQQDIQCERLNLSVKTQKELNERYAIIYTGQRRLARNLLREVMGKYIGNDDGIRDVLSSIQKIAVLMQYALQADDFETFAKLLNDHWENSKKLDGGCTNTCIDAIFESVSDLIDGRMICGAGGGGFLQVLMKKGVTVEQLNERFTEIFGDTGVEAWKCEFDF